MKLKLKLSGLYSSLFGTRFSLISKKKLVVGGNRKEPSNVLIYSFRATHSVISKCYGKVRVLFFPRDNSRFRPQVAYLRPCKSRLLALGIEVN